MAKRNLRNVESNIGIIVTRPNGQSQNFINRLKKGGFAAFDLPGIMIVPTRYQKNAIETLSHAAQYDYLLFTSPNSVRFAKRLKLNFQNVKGFISIGSGTEKALKPYIKNKESITAAKPYTSEALIETLKERDITGKSILIVSGEGGRRLLDSAINELGGTGEYCDVYRREIPEEYNIEPILSFKSAENSTQRSLYLTISSQEAFMNLLPTLESSGIKQLLDGVFVGSERLKNIVKSEGFENIIVARSALENDLWHAIVNHTRNQLDISPSIIATDNGKDLSMTQSQKKNEPNKKENVTPHPEEAAVKDKDSAQSDEKSAAKAESSIQPESAVKSESTSPSTPEPSSKKESTATAQTDSLEAETATKTESGSDNLNPKKAQAIDAQQSQKAPSRALTYIALVLALGGLGLGGAAFYESNIMQAGKISALSATIDTDNTKLSSLTSEISMLEKEIAALKATTEKAAASGNNQSLQDQVSLIAQKNELLNSAIASAAKGLQQQIDNLKSTQEKLSAQNQEIDNIAKVSNQAITIANDFDKKLAEQQLEQSVVLNEAKQLISTIKNITDLEVLRTTEVDYLLKTAIQKVRFDKDYKTAISILNSALDRISQISTVNFNETKNLIERNISELKTIQPITLVEVTNRLDKITSLIQQAPFKSDSALENLKNEVFNQGAPEGETWTDKLTSSLKHLIVIEDKRIEAPELMAKEDRFFLLQNIQLELTAAKVAILQDQFTVFRQSITTVQAWIKTYFDEDSADVREAIKQIQWLLDAKIEVTPPNIERTLTDFEATLRAYKGATQ